MHYECVLLTLLMLAVLVQHFHVRSSPDSQVIWILFAHKSVGASMANVCLCLCRAVCVGAMLLCLPCEAQPQLEVCRKIRRRNHMHPMQSSHQPHPASPSQPTNWRGQFNGIRQRAICRHAYAVNFRMQLSRLDAMINTKDYIVDLLTRNPCTALHDARCTYPSPAAPNPVLL